MKIYIKTAKPINSIKESAFAFQTEAYNDQS